MILSDGYLPFTGKNEIIQVIIAKVIDRIIF